VSSWVPIPFFIGALSVRTRVRMYVRTYVCAYVCAYVRRSDYSGEVIVQWTRWGM
jgi:hypothetical protein